MSDTLRECVVRDELIAAESIFAENVDVESTDLAASRLSLRFPRLDQRPSVSVVVVLPDDAMETVLALTEVGI